jgi:hypothetical protein
MVILFKAARHTVCCCGVWEVSAVANGWPHWLCVCPSNAVIPSPTRRLGSLIAVCWGKRYCANCLWKRQGYVKRRLIDPPLLKTNSFWDIIYTEIVAGTASFRGWWIRRGLHGAALLASRQRVHKQVLNSPCLIIRATELAGDYIRAS